MLNGYRDPPMPPDFGFVANHPALDFCNTVGAWVDGVPERDKLARYPDFVAWARGARLLTPAEAAALRTPRNAARLLARARAFRSALYALVTAALAGRRPDPADLATVEHELARARAAQRLAPSRGGYAAAWVDPADPERPLLEAARAAARLLEVPLDRIHRCAGEDCGWLFRDTSRAGRRRWCSMTTCGNTAKVRRFRGRDR
jgi:predicted RNA-binding Zn ribbon-like protein